MRAQGVGPVLDFMVLTVRQRGALDALRLGLADRRRREAVAEEALAREVRPAGRRAGPADLDADYGLSAEAWGAWAPLLDGAPPSPDPYDEAFADADLNFWIEGGEEEPEALTRTRAAISRMGTELSADVSGAMRSPDSRQAWVVFLRAGDAPSANLPRELARATRGGVAEVASFDMLRREGDRVFPLFAPGANLTLLAAVDYLFGRVALRGSALPSGELGRLDVRRAILDWAATQSPLQARGRWRHVGRPVIEANLSGAEVASRRAEAVVLGRRPATPPRQGVSVVICTRDKGHLIRQLVRGLLAQPASHVAEVVIVANRTTNAYALAALEDLECETRVRVVRSDQPFNFSRLCNAGVAETREPGPLLFLNDDIAPVSEDWLPRLLQRLETPAVGAAGPLLLYPDERVQHAGMYLGCRGSAGHALRGARLPDQDYLFTAVAAREVSCLTGAVLLVRREAFQAMNGFDDQLATYLQDVDFGLRLGRSGWLNVFEPASVLIHMESASIRDLERSSAFHRQREAELRRFTDRWGDAAHDPYHPPALDPQDEEMRRLTGPGGARPTVGSVSRAVASKPS